MKPEKNSVRLAIDGMRCAGCVGAVETALRAVPGVESAEVNFAAHTASVTGAAPVEALIEAVAKAGYRGTEMVDEAAAEQSRDAEAAARYRQLLRQSTFALAMAVPAIGISMPAMLGLGGHALMHAASPWLALMTLAVIGYSGPQFFIGMWQALRGGHATMDTLVALGMAAAWSYSACATFAPAWFPAGTAEPFWDAIPVVIGLVVLGQALEMRARGRASEAVRRLLDLRPKTARVVRDGIETDIPLMEVRVGDTLRVRPGEQLPVDGIVTDGHSRIDAAMLTGEPMPVEVTVGSAITGGTLNQSGSFLFSATRVGAETRLAQIVALVRQAQGTKPAIGRLADRIAGVFVPLVLLVAGLTLLAWLAVGPEPRLNHALVAAVSVLVIACPCALGLATPMAVMVGVGKAAEHGILIRHGDALQQAGQLTCIVLDKTGTVTQGKPAVTATAACAGHDADTLLRLAASLEASSEHPLATAILESASARGLALSPAGAFHALPGQGVYGKVEGHELSLGSRALMLAQGIPCESLAADADRLAAAGATTVFLAADGRLAGLIGISDPVKPDSAEAIDRLRRLGMKVILLTGDSHAAAAAVAAQVGIDSVFAEVLPQDKDRKIAELIAAGEVVGMVGDGINDAIALSRADVGFAIGAGADVAIEAADITLMSGSLHGVANAIAISRATVRNIRQNLAGAFFYNILGIPVAAGLLYPFFGLLLNPMIAGAAMALSSITVVSNARRLRRFQPS